MPSPSAVAPRATGEPLRLPHTATRAVFALISFVLVALFVLPLIVQHETGRITARIIRVAEPARDLVEDVERDLARQVSAVQSYGVRRAPELAGRFEEARADQARALARLAPLADSLGPAAAAGLARVRDGIERWQRLPTAVLAGRVPAHALVVADASQDSVLESTVSAAGELDDVIGAYVTAGQGRLHRIRRADTLLTVVLAGLALASALAGAWLGRRIGELAMDRDARAREEARLRAELEEVAESRARLMRGFGHDVKNALGAADGYAQLLETGALGELGPRQLGSLERLRGANSQAILLIDDLLDLARSEAGQLVLHLQPVDLGPLVEDLTEEYRARLETAGLELSRSVPDDLPVIESDGGRIRQIVGNLLSNAAKYTPAGGAVAVRVEASGDTAAIDVVDTGPGIPAEEREAIFQEFIRLGSAEGGPSGAGIGLAISRRLARMLGGDLSVESAPGRGARFILRLPLREPSADSTGPA